MTPARVIKTKDTAGPVKHTGLRARFLLIALSLLYIGEALYMARSKPLWYDELVGLSIAQAPSWSALLPTLERSFDISPPLYHVATRACVLLFGDGNIATRLPAIAGVLVLSLALYFFTVRRMPTIFGALAFTLPGVTAIRGFSVEARPYAMLLGFAGLVLVAYQGAAAGRKPDRIWLAVTLAAASLTHYYGILLVFPIAAGEAVRTWRNRKFDLGLLAALAAPAFALLSIHTLIRAQAAQNTRFHSRGAWVQLLGAYEEYRVDTWMLLCIVLFLAVACCLWDARFKEAAHAEAWAPRIPHHELAALAGFTLLPAAGMLVATLVTHAYISRYFLPAIVGLSILATTLLACLLANRLPIAYALLALIAALELFDAARIARRLTRGRPDIAILAGDRSLNLPVVFEDAKDLLYAQRNHAASARKFWYLASPEESARIQQFDTDDLAMLRLKQDTGDPQIVPLADFLSTKDAFYLYVRDGRSVGWLSEFLLRSGMRVTLQRYVPGGMLFLATK